MATKSLIRQIMDATGPAVHPHPEPINAATFKSDFSLGLAKVTNLMAYQKFLASARAAKARRKGASMAFERNVQGQARRALGDLESFCGAALRVTQQANQTDAWGQIFDRMTSAVKATGPLGVKQLWQEINDNPQYKSALQTQGVSDDMLTAVTQAISKIDASLVLQNGSPAVQVQVAGIKEPSTIPIKRPGSPPANIGDLLRTPQFDQVVSAFTNSAPVYLEAVPSPTRPEFESSYFFALGAVAARQRMADHVRKLEDSGLATYQGNDPVDILIGALVVALFVGLVGWGLLEVCDRAQDNDASCTIGEILLYLAIIVLVALTAIGLSDGIAFLIIGWIAVILWLPELIADWSYLPGTSFQPQGSGSG